MTAVLVRRHRRRSPGSQPRTGFDWRTETLITQWRSRLGLAEAQGDIEGAERLRREVEALEAKYKQRRLALADREGDTEGAERLRRELAELSRSARSAVANYQLVVDPRLAPLDDRKGRR